MMIAPGEAGSDARSDPTPNIGPLDSAPVALLAHGETDTARTHRTKPGPLGCRAGQRAGRRSLPPRVFCKSNRFWLAPQHLTSPCSRAVRALSAVSALCPILLSVETSHAPSPVDRCLGLDCSERRCRPRPVQ